MVFYQQEALKLHNKQGKQGIDTTGSVDERTATVIAEEEKEVKPSGGSQPSRQLIGKGHIRESTGSPVNGVRVRDTSPTK